MTTIPVNPRVLVWARSERGLDTIAAAERLGITPDDLSSLEEGETVPNITQLRQMAAKYGISFSALLMPEPLPPASRLKVTDFRTRDGGEAVWTPELLAMLDDVNLLIDGLADLRDAAPTEFRPVELPRVTTATEPDQVAAAERARLRLRLETQLGLNTPAEVFRHFRTLLEESGVFVYVIRAGDADDWRGLAIYDERQIPVIIINGDETQPAWRLFTLFHEYYHLLLRLTGISDERSGTTTEALCNRFAAHFLMPPDQFMTEARFVNQGHRPWDLRDVRILADRFHVSLTAVAIHLEGVGLAAAGFGHQVMAMLNRPARRQRKGTGGPDYYEQMEYRWGGRHFDVVFRALDAGAIDRIEAYELTTVQPENFARMRAEVAEHRAAYGRGP